MRSSATTNDIAAALAKAQGAFHTAAKSNVNPHFRARKMLLSGGIKLNGVNGHQDAETGEVLQ